VGKRGGPQQTSMEVRRSNTRIAIFRCASFLVAVTSIGVSSQTTWGKAIEKCERKYDRPDQLYDSTANGKSARD